MYHRTTKSSLAHFTHVLIVDDHPLYSDALETALQHIVPDGTFEKAGTLREAFERLDRGAVPELVMFDLKLPDVAGISGFRNLRARLPQTPILVISALTSVEIVQTLMAEGAAGFMPKDSSAEDLRRALRDIAAGQKFLPKDYQQSLRPREHAPASGDMPPTFAHLSPQQQRVMKLICAGKPNKQIAYELDLAEATVKAHITALLRRLGVQNRTQAAVMMEAALQDTGEQIDTPESHAFLSR